MTSSTVAGIDLMELAAQVVPLLNDEQRAFILSREPTRADQAMTPAEWDTVDCHVDLPRGWDDITWWGWMECAWGPGKAMSLTFRFNDLGLAVAAALRARASLIEEERS